MTKRGKKKAKIVDYVVVAEVAPISRVEVIYDDTKDQCMEFYKKVLTTHNRCRTSSKQRLDVLPTHEKYLEKVQDRI